MIHVFSLNRAVLTFHWMHVFQKYVRLETITINDISRVTVVLGPPPLVGHCSLRPPEGRGATDDSKNINECCP